METSTKKYIMWKKIGLVALCLVIGCVLGGILSMAYLGHSMATGMFALQEKEIFKIGETTNEAYYNQPNEVAIWALENYIKILNELKEERSPAKVKNPYFILSPYDDLVFAHLRLGKLYKRINNIEKSKYHLEQAISCSKYSKFGVFSTEEDCSRILDALDKAYNENLEKQR